MPLPYLLALACGGSKDDGVPPTDVDPTGDTQDTAPVEVPPDPETVPLAGPCPYPDAYGGFGVVSDALLSVVSGAVADGVVPLTVLEQVQREGSCSLLQRVSPFCDPPCGPGETCGLLDECVPYPTQQDVGTITLEGLLEPVTMEPSEPGNNYFAFDLPHPPYEPGVLLTLTAAGGDLPGFELHGVGLVPLALEPGEWVLRDGEPLEVRWVAPGGPVRSTAHLLVTIDQHGVSPLQLACDFEDTGTGVVPAGLVSAFVGAGVTGFPSATLTRRTVDSASIGHGCVDFAVEWPLTGEVRVDGFTPCTEQADCPAGQTCDTTLEICV